MIYKNLSFKGCQPGGSRRCWKEEWSRGERSLGWRQSTRELCRDFSRCPWSVELLDSPKVWNVPNLWVLLEILMVILKCRSLGVTSLCLLLHYNNKLLQQQQLCPCLWSELHSWAGIGLQGWKSGLFLIFWSPRGSWVMQQSWGWVLIPNGAEWIKQRNLQLLIHLLSLCGFHVLSWISLFFRWDQGSEIPPPAAGGSSSTLQVRLPVS